MIKQSNPSQYTHWSPLVNVAACGAVGEDQSLTNEAERITCPYCRAIYIPSPEASEVSAREEVPALLWVDISTSQNAGATIYEASEDKGRPTDVPYRLVVEQQGTTVKEIIEGCFCADPSPCSESAAVHLPDLYRRLTEYVRVSPTVDEAEYLVEIDENGNVVRVNKDSGELKPTTPVTSVEAVLATEADGEDCVRCGVDHFNAMHNALTDIHDYSGRDIQAIKNTAYRALPDSDCLAVRSSDASKEEEGYVPCPRCGRPCYGTGGLCGTCARDIEIVRLKAEIETTQADASGYVRGVKKALDMADKRIRAEKVIPKDADWNKGYNSAIDDALHALYCVATALIPAPQHSPEVKINDDQS